MKRSPVVTRDDAISIVSSALANGDRQESSPRIAVLDEEPRQLWWAWIVPVQSVEYVTSREPIHLLLGLGPYLVDKFTREVIPTGAGTRLHSLERARGYRAWWDFRGPNSIMKL